MTASLISDKSTKSHKYQRIARSDTPQPPPRLAAQRTASFGGICAFERISCPDYVFYVHSAPQTACICCHGGISVAGDRAHTETAVSGDIIGLHNHGTIQIGDTFTAGEALKFKGIPHFAPELFKRIRLKDPLKLKQLQKGLTQLSEEGSTQVFMPLHNNDLIVGAVGVLQFEVVAFRLKDEYKVDCVYEPVSIHVARWVDAADPAKLEEFRRKAFDNLAIDGGGYLTYLAPTRVNLNLMEERWSEISFRSTREH